MASNSAPNASTFDLVPPTRPGTTTFNGLKKVDDENDTVPDPTTMPNAAEWNTLGWLHLSVGRVMPVLVISIVGSTGAVAYYGSANKNVTISSFTPNHMSAGVVQITWPPGTFPSSTMLPQGALNSGPGMIWVELIANGFRVHTYNASGAAADLNSTVTVY